MTERSYTECRFSDLSYCGACSWESALFRGPDDFNGCGYFHISLLLIALRHISRHWKRLLRRRWTSGEDNDSLSEVKVDKLTRNASMPY